MSTPRIHRVTLFKLPDPEAQQKLLDAYETLGRKQSKDGKPYLLYLCAGASTNADLRAQGYTVAAQTEFASEEDVLFYDEQCAAHGELKRTATALGLAGKPLTMSFSGSPMIS
ncbi:hypothetical protein GGTG_11417 [Gaeumannomyces tritici R3-111a-1]|uniref:Stress-response A/B barrel domain-containing protein n=1 Tax=Gaeumannomyces tritici (strain R3-111a-1) TaxID=644352 RepID=J3PD48_GAET3|nr:hypothetical protein GGTG_11417 [Gaeumannomyces tritici R3-111a-1]EJT70393.1 hypothetical protein GGTG_11417 [Gaeumannomyces tritici R3-111a-1]